MFTDCRSKKVIFLAHCFLNQNSISDGTAVFPAAFESLIGKLLENGIGIVQMPCPELMCLGLKRGNPKGAESPVTVENTRIRREMLKPEIYKKLKTLTQGIILQIEEYTRNGFEVVGILGVNRSPCCGVETTSDENREIPGKGLFMELTEKMLREKRFQIPMTGLKKETDINNVLNKLINSKRTDD